MIHRKSYCPKDSDFNNYFANQTGSGSDEIRIVRGPRYQKGYGIGSFFSRLATPIMKYLGKQALNKSVEIGKHVVNDPHIQQTLKESVSDLTSKGLSKIREKVTSQKGRGHKRLYKRKRKMPAKKAPRKVKKPTCKRVSNKKAVKKRKKTRKSKDIFG